MARGHQKIQSQQKNAKKQAEMKKSKGHDQKMAAKAALVFTCSVCKVHLAPVGIKSISQANFIRRLHLIQTGVKELHILSEPSSCSFRVHFES